MPLRFRWNHRSAAHRTIVKAANRGLATLPFENDLGSVDRGFTCLRDPSRLGA